MPPFGHRCPNVSALRGKQCVTSRCRLVSVASFAVSLDVRYSSIWYDDQRFHQKPNHSADHFHLQTSNPASVPAQVQGSVRFQAFLGHDDRVLFLRFGHGYYRLWHGRPTLNPCICTRARRLSDVAAFVWSIAFKFRLPLMGFCEEDGYRCMSHGNELRRQLRGHIRCHWRISGQSSHPRLAGRPRGNNDPVDFHYRRCPSVMAKDRRCISFGGPRPDSWRTEPW
ncbi:hypothetical protein BJX99DRAFT_41053 [Aspergillus californicus]